MNPKIAAFCACTLHVQAGGTVVLTFQDGRVLADASPHGLSRLHQPGEEKSYADVDI